MNNINTYLVNILNSIDSYYDKITTILSSSPEHKSKEQKFILLKDKFILLKEQIDSKLDPWEKTHVLKKINKIISSMYDIVNFEITEGSEVSSNTVRNLEEHFSSLQKIYKIYAVDFQHIYEESIDTAYEEVKNNSPLEWQTNFHKNPNSIDLYLKCMKNYDGKKDDILNQLELDKSASLGEKKIISPYFSFSLFPSDEPIIKTIPKHKAADCVIELSRNMSKTIIYNRPKLAVIGNGPDENNIKSLISPVVFSTKKNVAWDISIKNPDGKNITIYEQFAKDAYRKLYSGNDTVLKNRIIAKQFGRPLSYNNILDKNLSLNEHIARLANRDRIPHSIDIDLLIGKIKERLRKKLSKITIEDFLTAGHGFSIVLINELETSNIPRHLNSVLIKDLYLIEKRFYREMLKSFVDEEKSPDNKLTWFDNNATIILTSILRANDNIFNSIRQTMYLNEYIFNM